MAVNINEAGRYRQAASVDGLLCAELGLIQSANLDDRVTFHGNIGRKPKLARTVDHITVANNEIKLRFGSLAAGRQARQTNDGNCQSFPDHVERPHDLFGKKCCRVSWSAVQAPEGSERSLPPGG